MKILVVAAALLLSGCAVSLPFNNRLGFDSISQMKAVRIDPKPSLSIKWTPVDFPQRIDVHGSDGFVGGGSRTRLPTGQAMSSRILEAVSQYADLSPEGDIVELNVLSARTGFEYSAGIFNVTPAIDDGNVDMVIQFTMHGKTWTQTFTSSKHDPVIGGTSQTGTLEAAWDDVAVQVAQSIAKHL